MICYLKNVSDYELHYVIPLYKYILGGAGSSRLFNSVREENSLAYYSFAREEKDDKYIDIISGIEKKNYDKALNIIKNELNKMNNITPEELESAKKEIISILKESSDNILNVLSRVRTQELFGLPSDDEFIENINKVTKEEVEKIVQKVDLKLSYFLQGCDDNG